MIEVTRGFRRRFSSLKTTGCVISGPGILLLSTGIVDDARTKGFCQAFEIGRGKLKLVNPVGGGVGGVIVVVVAVVNHYPGTIINGDVQETIRILEKKKQKLRGNFLCKSDSCKQNTGEGGDWREFQLPFFTVHPPQDIRTKRGEHREGSGEKSLLRIITYFRYCLIVLSRFPLVTRVHVQNKKKTSLRLRTHKIWTILRTGTTNQIEKR